MHVNTVLSRFCLAIGAAVLFLSLLPYDAAAQPGGGPGAQIGDRVERQVKVFVEKLALTDSQTVSVRAIVTASMEEGAKERQQFMGDREALKTAMRERTDRMYAEVEKILTAEQKTTFETVKAEQRDRARDRFRNGPGGPGGEQR